MLPTFRYGMIPSLETYPHSLVVRLEAIATSIFIFQTPHAQEVSTTMQAELNASIAPWADLLLGVLTIFALSAAWENLQPTSLRASVLRAMSGSLEML
jgi:hypothetical protein